MMQMHEIAHYGRWFPFEGRILPYWWYDKYSERVISIDELCLYMKYSRVSEINVEDCLYAGKVPFFRVNIPELELKYAKVFMPEKVKIMMQLNMEEMDVFFRKCIEERNSTAHWYRYELDVLTVEARKWCHDNSIPCQG